AASEQRKLVEAAIVFQEELLDLSKGERGRYDLAERLAKVADAAAAKAKDESFRAKTKKRLAEAKFMARWFEDLKPALAKLKDNPADPKANTQVGSFYA